MIELILVPYLTGGGYRYGVLLDGEKIIDKSVDPEHAAARILKDRDVTGKAVMLSNITSRPRMYFDIEKFAKTRTEENAYRGPRKAPWRAFPSKLK